MKYASLIRIFVHGGEKNQNLIKNYLRFGEMLRKFKEENLHMPKYL